MLVLIIFFSLLQIGISIQDSKRLFDDLMLNYINHRRASSDPNQQTDVHVRLSLSQLIDLDEINQIMMCSVWLRQTWIDPRLAWEPKEYGGVDILHIPHELIWVPDIILFNSDSSYNITISTKATIYSNGRVIWEPPAIFRSICQIKVEWFPFDEFSFWSYPAHLINLEIIDNAGLVNSSNEDKNQTISWNGVDISDFYPSVEWDIMTLKAVKQVKNYGKCCETLGPFVELTFELGLRRKTFFYTLNLLVPCISMAFLTLLVFYLPSESGEKIQLSISILVSITFFFLLLTEMLPATGHVMPLIAKYLLFTMLMVASSVGVAVLVLNLHFRKQTTHKMGKLARELLLHRLPKLLRMRPHKSKRSARKENDAKKPKKPDKYEKDEDEENEENEENTKTVRVQIHRAELTPVGRRRRSTLTHIGLTRELCKDLARAPVDERLRRLYYSPIIIKAIENIDFIGSILRKQQADSEAEHEWEYLANVVDHLFLWIFAVICVVGTVWIFGQAPLLYDNRQPYMLTNSNQITESLEELVKQIDK